MSRIYTPQSIDEAPKGSQPFLGDVQNTLGTIPNLFRIAANSPAALESLLGFKSALNQGSLDVATRERIALALAEVNGCNYCLVAHTYLGQKVANLTANEVAKNRQGVSTDVKANSAVQLAAEIARNRGTVSAESIEAVRAAGYSDGEIVEIIAHVALNTFTNYINTVLETENDFPVVNNHTA